MSVCRLTLCLSLSLMLIALGLGYASQSKNTDTPNSASRHALVVGVTGYDNRAFSDLRFTENDADGLAEAVARKEAGFKVRLLTTSRGKKDKADAPTAANIAKALDTMLAKRKKGDIVLLAFAGHGVSLELKDPDGKEKPRTYPYFCPADADLLDPRFSDGDSKTMVNLDELFAKLGKCGAGTKLVLMDACRNEISVKAGRRSFDAKSVSIPDGVAALYSCGRGQFAFEKDKLDGDKGHGIFFHFAIQALTSDKARNDEGVVTWTSMSDYVIRQTSRQVPILIGDAAKQTPASMGSLEGEPPVLVQKTQAVVKTDKDSAKVEDKPKDKRKELVNSIKMTLMPIPAGKFNMGSPEDEKGREGDESLHEVTISKPFHIGAYEVTQAQWSAVMGENNNPSHWSMTGGGAVIVKGLDTDDFPVDAVSWEMAVEFCEKLSALPAEKNAGRSYRLPTEAEWEYACRAGTKTPYNFGDTISPKTANMGYDSNLAGHLVRTAKVGSYKKPNDWGLHDLHGNVWEWTADWYGQRYYKTDAAAKDPTGPEEGQNKVMRGGSYRNGAEVCRAAARNSEGPKAICDYIGFRVVCEVKQAK